MADEKINSTANNIQIDVDNLSYVDYLWTQRTSDTAIQGVRLDQRNLPLNLNADTVDNKHASDFASASHTHNYAGSGSAGGPANSVKGALTFGAKTYNGSTSQEITLSDLGGNIINCYDTSTSDKAGTWTVSIPNVTELTEGLTIKIRLKTSYNSTKNTLNVNGLGAKTIYFRYGNKLTGHYPKESVLALTYTSDAISSGNDKSGWIVENIYDSTNTFQLRKYYSRYTTKSVLYRYMICFVNKDNLLVPANNENNSTSTNKTLTIDSFDLTKGIYYYNSTTTVKAGSLTPTSTLYQQIGLVNLQYSFNTGTTLTANKPVYLVVTPLGEHGEVMLATNPIAQEIPTANDGNSYVFLGYAYDTYRIELTIEHPVYVYNSIKGCYISEDYSQNSNIKNNTTDIYSIKTSISNLESNKISKDAIATSTTLGLVKSSTTGTTANRDYKVQVNSDGTMKVNVPWTDTDTNTHNSHAIFSGTKSDNSTQIKGSASSGDITLGDSGVTAGTYRSVTVNSKGIVVAGSQTDNDTNTWRRVQLNGTDKLGTGINTNPLNIEAGSNMTITESNGTFTFAATDTNTTYAFATGDSNGQIKVTPNGGTAQNISVKGLGSAAYTASTAYATSGHTHSFSQITSRGESFLDWGGKNFSGSYGPIDAAMVPELGANRFAFMPANAVTIEYSRDGGATWTDYGAADYQKIGLFNGIGSGFTIGKASSGAGNIATNKYQLRVNIYTSAGSVYTVLNKFVIYLSTSGTNNNWCTIRARKQSDYTAGNDTWTTFADKISVSGWSGYNVINTSGITTYGNTASTQYGHIQFIFGCDTGSTNNSYPGLTINKIFGFGGVGWTTPSTMAKTGHMYTYDSSQNVTFPAAITSGAVNSYNILPRGNNTYNLGSDSSRWANIHATTIHENGKTLSAKYIAKPLLTTKGDMIYASGTSNPERLGIGSNGQFLSIANGVPKWVNNPNSDTHYTNYLQIKGNGTEAVKFTQNADKSLNLKSGNNVSISAASGEITISATVPTKSSWNYDDTYVKYSAAQSLNDTQKAQARTNIGAGTITEIKVNGTSKGTSGSVNLTNMVTFASSQTATVAGTSKTTYTYNQPTGDSNTGSSNGSAYFPEGIIMGGTAASAGLVTRGICGVTTPDATTGACSKENLYINYDGDNNNNPNGRGVVINAGSSGSDLGNGVYSYCAVRGDAMKAYCDNHYATKAELNATNSFVDSAATKIDSLFNYFDNNGIAKKATADGNGNNIVNTYATKSALNTTNSNVTTLQGYFSSGIAKKATADKNGNDITTEYVHTRVDGGTFSDQMFSQIKHITNESGASVYISADNAYTYYGGNVWVTTDSVQLYYGDGTQDGCRFYLTQTGATLEFDGSGTQYSIITTKDTATANNAGVIKAAAVRTSAITTTQGGTTSGRYYGVELDSNGKAFVNVPWTDNNTTYSAGTGLSLSGTTFSANTSLGLINSSSANVFDIYRLNSSSYRLKIIRGSHTFSFSSATGFPGGSITFPNGASMPSSNYHVMAWSSDQGNVDVYQIKTFSKETTGFQIVTRAYSSTRSFSVQYIAICTV